MKALRTHKKKILTHVICWAVYIIYEIEVAAVMSGKYSAFFYYVFFYLLNIGLFYLHALYVMPLAFGQGKPVRNIPILVDLLVLEFITYLGLTVVVCELLFVFYLSPVPLKLDFRFFAGSSWRAILFIVTGSGYYFLMSHIRRTKEEVEARVEVERLRYELVSLKHDFLRSQINPHLLFNTLNFVRYAAKHQPEESEDAVIRLSEIMRFAMQKDMKGCISLDQEVRQVENLIRINQLRYDNSLHVFLTVKLHDQDVLVLPILLLTLIENVFKHGNLSNPAKPATIEVRSTPERVSFYTSNLPKPPKRRTVEAGGTGLKNIQQRLENAFPDRHQFNFGMEDDFFVVRLTMFTRPQ